jgi:flavin-binding protein dodecin
MASVYRIIDVVGTSPSSWEEASAQAVRTASATLRDLRVAEVVKLDMTVDDEGEVLLFRSRMQLSFKYEPGS